MTYEEKQMFRKLKN